MARLTKKSYNRRLVLFGIMLFIGIGLVSTGFAAWVMSTNAELPGEGNVTGTTITDSSLSINLEKQNTLGTISFGAKEGDETGRIRGDGQDVESLSITIKGTVTPTSVLSKLLVSIKIPDNLQAAAAANYIVLPDCAVEQDITKLVTNETGAFEYTITFKWGSVFKGENPSVYYDGTGKSISDAKMKETMQNFRKTLSGNPEITDDQKIDFKLNVTLKALAN